MTQLTPPARLNVSIAVLMVALLLPRLALSEGVSAPSTGPIPAGAPDQVLDEARRLMDQERHRAARDLLQLALQRDPGEPGLILGLAELKLRLRKPRRALELASEAERALGLHGDLLAVLAQASLDRLDLPRAEKASRRLTLLEPGLPRGACWLARTLAHLGRCEEAARVLEPWTRSHPEDPQVLVALAVLRDHSGDRQLALALRRRAVAAGAKETGQ